MTRTLYLHIGNHRTATTSIQSFLRKNFYALQTKGYLNPFAAGRHFHLINQIFSGAVSMAEVAEDLNARADGKQHEIGAFIISDEDICLRRDLSPLARFREHFDVRVIFSMRRQDLWLESWHQQNVKWQWNPRLAHLTFPEFLARRKEFFWIDYDHTVRQLEQLFGAEALRLIVFEKGQMPGGPVESFARAVDLDTEGLTDPPHTNTSMSPLMSEFMRTLPLDEFPGPHRRVIEQACAQADKELKAETGPQGALLMDLETRKGVLESYAKGNARLAERHFGRDTLFQDPLPGAEAPLAPQSLPTDSYETLARFVAPMLRALVAQRIADEAEKDSSRKA